MSFHVQTAVACQHSIFLSYGCLDLNSNQWRSLRWIHRTLLYSKSVMPVQTGSMSFHVLRWVLNGFILLLSYTQLPFQIFDQNKTCLWPINYKLVSLLFSVQSLPPGGIGYRRRNCSCCCPLKLKLIGIGHILEFRFCFWFPVLQKGQMNIYYPKCSRLIAMSMLLFKYVRRQ